MTFTPQDQTFAEAAEAYRRVWVAEGSAIVDAMERGTGLTFLDTQVNAVIFEGVSHSGMGDSPMYFDLPRGVGASRAARSPRS